MKRILFILSLCLVGFFTKAQSPYTGLTGYAVKQSLGSDSSIVQSKGALSGRMVIYNFADTTTANTQRIKNYPGALIFTTDSSKLWLRNKFASAWGGIASTAGSRIISIDIFSDSSWVICYSDGSCDTIDVNNQTFVTINNLFNGCNNLLAGGIVTANDPSNTLVFDVTAADYTINCKLYHTDLDQITLSDGHATLDRFDVVIVDTNEVVSVIEGTPSADPQVPQINHSSQLVLTTFLVPAGATTATDLGITQTVIYDQNLGTPTEWNGAATAWTSDRDNTSFPFHLTKTYLLSGSTGSTSEFSFTTTDTMRNGQFDVFKFYIRLTDAWVAGQGFDISWYNGTTKVSNSVIFANNSYGFDQTVTGSYQTIAIPMANWVFSDSIYFKLVVKPLATPFSSQAFRVDWIQLQGGINQAIGGSSGLYIWNQYSLAQPANYWIAGAAKIEGGITSPNINYILSEQYGYNASVTAIAGTAVGAYSRVSGNNGTAIGDESTSAGGISLGYYARSGNSTNISIGGTTEGATSSNLFGKDGSVTGNQSFGVGQNVTVAHNNSYVFGYFGASTAASQWVVGSTNGSHSVTDFYFGNIGVSGTDANNVTWRISGESGTNQSGHTLNIGAGAGTGNASTGSIIDFQTSDAGASGTTLQTLTTKFRILQSGQLRALPYGDGTFSGTPTYVAAFDTDGNVIEWPPGGIGGGILTDADNGLSIRSSTIAVLGQNEAEVGNPAILLSNREIPMGGFLLSLNASATQAVNILQTKNAAAAVRARVTSDASFSNTGGQTGSEIFGDGASVTGTTAVAIGNNVVGDEQDVVIGSAASSTGGGSKVLIGKGTSSVSVNPGEVIIGTSATSTHASGGNNVIIGTAATSNAVGVVGVGYSAVSSGSSGVAIGQQSDNSFEYSIALGAFTTTTAANQFVLGSSNPLADGINDAYYGRGVTSTTANNFKMQPTGASGTNMAGNTFTIAGSKGTGNAAQGSIMFQTSVLEASGTTLQSLTDRMIVHGTGVVGIGKFSSFNSTRLEVVDDALGNANMVRFASASTAAASNGQKLVAATLSGTNATASQTTYTGWFNNSHDGTGAANFGVRGQASGGATNVGVQGESSGNSITDNYGVQGIGSGNSSTNNYGVYGSATGTSTNNYGGYFGAINGTNNYALVVPGSSGRVVFGATTSDANALLELVSTSQAFILMRMTATQASAITAANGMLLYVTNTDATFTSVGVWARENGAWVKL